MGAGFRDRWSRGAARGCVCSLRFGLYGAITRSPNIKGACGVGKPMAQAPPLTPGNRVIERAQAKPEGTDTVPAERATNPKNCAARGAARKSIARRGAAPPRGQQTMEDEFQRAAKRCDLIADRQTSIVCRHETRIPGGPHQDHVASKTSILVAPEIGDGLSTEVVAIRIGTAIIGGAARLLFSKGRKNSNTSLDMAELVRQYIPGLRQQRSVERQFTQIADSIAARLEPMLEHEFRGLDVRERESVVASVVDTFEQADLTDDALFELDVEPVRLARLLMDSIPQPVGLSEVGAEFYNKVLSECCDYYIRIVKHLPVFSERAIAELLVRSSEIGAEISQIIERLPVRTLYSPEGVDHDALFLAKYLDFISTTLDDVEMFSFATERPLRTKLSMAYISLKVASEVNVLRSFRKPAKLSRNNRYEAESSGLRVEAALRNETRVLIRGEAGSGKTTLLRWLAVTAARGRFSDSLSHWNGVVPIFIRLRSYGARQLPKTSEMLDDAAGVLTSVMPRGWVDRQLDTGRALLLIDGVDELLPKDRRNVRKWVKDILALYPSVRVVVTSRPAAARQDWLLDDNFTPILLEHMTRTDLSSFIRQWHQAVGASGQELPCTLEDLPGYERALAASIKDRPHLYSLASNPLLAAMLCSLNLSRARQLPRSRMEMYSIAVELLVQRRDAERHVPSADEISLSLTDKLDILRDLAWRLSDNNRSELALDKASEYVESKVNSLRHLEVDPAPILNYLLVRSGILRMPAQGRIDFVHRTFQEYLAASAAAHDDRIGNLIERAHLDIWRETIIMAAGHANMRQRNDLVTGIIGRASSEPRYRRQLRILAVSCLETMNSVDDDLNTCIEETLDDLVPPRRYDDAWSLALVGEPVRKRLPATVENLSPASAAATVRTATVLGGEEMIPLLAGYASDKRQKVHGALVAGWQYFDQKDRYADEVLAKIDSKSGLHVSVGSVAELKSIYRLTSVRHLIISYWTNFSSVDLDRLPELVTLKFRYLDGLNNIGDIANTHLARSLRSLQILGRGSGRAGSEKLANIRALSQFVNLRSLEFDFPSTSRILPTLPEGVRELGISGLSNSKVELTSLQDSQNITTLHLNGRSAAACLSRISIPNLRNLTLGNCDLEGHLEDIVERHPGLVRLGLLGVHHPADLSMLSGLKELEHLSLLHCRVDDVQIVDLSFLSMMSKLVELTYDIFVVEGRAAELRIGSYSVPAGLKVI